MYNGINIAKLRQAIQNFRFYARPSNADSSAPCTNSDLNNVIDRISELMSTFVDELEN